MDPYREEILTHYKHPSNYGDLPDATVTVREANASCGDLIELSLKVVDAKIVGVRFKGVGCALSIASASLLTEQLEGKLISDVARMSERFVLDLVGVEVSSMRTKCILLPFRALGNALKTFEKR